MSLRSAAHIFPIQEVIILKSVKSRLPILIAASVVLCLLIAGLSTALINSADSSMMEDLISRNKASMQQTAAALQKDFDTKSDFLGSVSKSISGEAKDFDVLLNRHKGHLASYAENGGFDTVLLADTDGNAYDAAGNAFDVSARDYFGLALKGAAGLSGRIDAPVGTSLPAAVVYYAPVYAANEPVAVLLGIAPAEIDFAAYADANDDLGSGMYILDKNGKLIMSSAAGKGSTFYDSVKGSKYADGSGKDYVEWVPPAAPAEETTEQTDTAAPVLKVRNSYYFAGDMPEGKGPFGWLTEQKQKSLIFMKKAMTRNQWTLYYVRPVTLSESTVAFRRLSRLLLFSIVLIFLVAMIAMLFIQWLNGRKITELAYKDEVTGRANWQKFRAVCNRRLASKSWWRSNHAALHININRFTVYNEYYGQKAGDHLLRYIAETLDLMCSAKELSAHRNADQFVVLWSFTDREQLEKRIHDFFDLLHDAPNSENLSVTVGVYLLGKRDKDIAQAIDLAGLAGQNAPESKNNTIVFFDEKLRAQINEEHELENLMHIALANGEFKLYLQPKHKVQDGTLAGAEALVRWVNPQKGFISPGQFIPLFEKNGFVDDVDNYILEQLCAFQQKRLMNDKKTVPISVNVSRVQLSDPKLADKICALVDRYKVPHRYIDLELTESACFDDMDVLIHTIDTLREMGFPVSMDDFGSGYSSLNLLKQLSFDTLKIDGEFFRHITDPDRANAVVRSIIDMAKSLKMKTVAEGIETEEQVEFLRTTDCDLIQGYYYSKPISADEFELYMTKNRIKES